MPRAEPVTSDVSQSCVGGWHSHGLHDTRCVVLLDLDKSAEDTQL